MISDKIKLVVFDMAGTTIQDNKEVETCFKNACIEVNLKVSDDRILSLQGYSKKEVFGILWSEYIGNENPLLTKKINHSYEIFKNILEDHYQNTKVIPTVGCLEVFDFCRKNNIKIALNTGFYRKITDIILSRIGWIDGLDKTRIKIGGSTPIDISVASDEVNRGRPYPDMINRAMNLLGIENALQVINIGDTPVDLQAGKAAKCLFSLAVTNGTHTKEQLSPIKNDGLLETIQDLIQYINEV